MNVLEFIFKLLWQFIQFEPGRFEELKEKAFNWRNKMQAELSTDAQGNLIDGKQWYHKLFKIENEWWFQVAAAMVFLFAVKSVRSWLMSDGSDDEDDDEDDIRPRKHGISIPNFKM